MGARAARTRGRNQAVKLIRSTSPEQTLQLGRALARNLHAPAVVLLCGRLGTGKTTMTRGLAEGLGVADPALVHSPSFTLVNIYPGRVPIYHVDLYRLAGARDVNSIGLEDFMGREGVTIVEWGERISNAGEVALIVELEDAGGESRILNIREPGKPVRKKRRRIL